MVPRNFFYVVMFNIHIYRSGRNGRPRLPKPCRSIYRKLPKHLELASSIAGLTEEIEELRSEKNRILARARCADDEGMKVFSSKLDQSKRDYNALIESKTALTAERQDGITQYEDVYERIQPGDEEAVKTERQRLRSESESRISETVSKIYGDSFDPKPLSDAMKETDLDLALDRRVEEYRQALHKSQSIDRNDYFPGPER